MERGELFEDPLYDWLERNGCEVIDGGGGTMVHADGRAISDFFVEFAGSREQIGGAIEFVKSLGVPVGSSYRIADEDYVLIGDCRGVEFSLDKRAGRGKSKQSALFEAVEAAIDCCGRLFYARENDNRLVFAIYGRVPNDIRTALGALADEYSRYAPQISPVPKS